MIVMQLQILGVSDRNLDIESTVRESLFRLKIANFVLNLEDYCIVAFIAGHICQWTFSHTHIYIIT